MLAQSSAQKLLHSQVLGSVLHALAQLVARTGKRGAWNALWAALHDPCHVVHVHADWSAKAAN